MAIWKLEPVNPDEHHWRNSTYVGHLIVRAQDEAGARGLASDAFSVVSVLVPGFEAREPWTDGKIVTCERTTETDFDEEGSDTVLGPGQALAKAHPLQTGDG